MNTKRTVTWCWTNWTFGVWYARFSTTSRAWGIDLGPLEIVWKERRGQRRANHR